MFAPDAGRAASRALHRAGWLLHAYVVETKLCALRAAVKRYDPNQPRVPAGNPDGGQWTGGTGSESNSPTAPDSFQEATTDQRIQLAGDITGFTRHGINQTITRGVSPSTMLDTLTNPLQILPQANGTTRYIEAGAVVVLNPAGGVVTVWRR